MTDKEIRELWKKAFQLSWKDPRDTVIIFARLLEEYHEEMVENQESYECLQG